MARREEVGLVQSMWEQQWRERVEAWRGSGLTQRAFCQAHGVSPSSFSHWKHKLSQRDEERAQALTRVGGSAESATAVSWTEVRWPAEAAQGVPVAQAGSGFEIVLPRGWSVRLGSRFEVEPLRRLLSVLEERSC